MNRVIAVTLAPAAFRILVSLNREAEEEIERLRAERRRQQEREQQEAEAEELLA